MGASAVETWRAVVTSHAAVTDRVQKALAAADLPPLSWFELLQAVKALEPKVIPADAFKLSAQDQAAIKAVEEARKKQKRGILYTTVTIIVSSSWSNRAPAASRTHATFSSVRVAVASVTSIAPGRP